MKPADAPNSPMGGEGKTVEADWTDVRRKPGMKVKRGLGHMRPVFSLVERDGSVRSLHVPNLRADNLNEAMQHASSKSRLMTDGAPVFTLLGYRFAGHRSVASQARRIRAGRRLTYETTR